MFGITRGSHHSFKLGVLAGIFLFLAIDCLVGLLTLEDFRMVRFLLLIVFSALGVTCTLTAYRKI